MVLKGVIEVGRVELDEPEVGAEVGASDHIGERARGGGRSCACRRFERERGREGEREPPARHRSTSDRVDVDALFGDDLLIVVSPMMMSLGRHGGSARAATADRCPRHWARHTRRHRRDRSRHVRMPPRSCGARPSVDGGTFCRHPEDFVSDPLAAAWAPPRTRRRFAPVHNTRRDHGRRG